MTDSDKLRIALMALFEIDNHPIDSEASAWEMRIMAQTARREIQRNHYLVEPSKVVQEMLIGVRL